MSSMTRSAFSPDGLIAHCRPEFPSHAVFLGHMLHTPPGGGGGGGLVLVRLYLYACLSAADIIVNSSVILELPPLC